MLAQTNLHIEKIYICNLYKGTLTLKIKYIHINKVLKY